MARLLWEGACRLRIGHAVTSIACGLSPGPHGSDVLSAEPLKIPFFTELKSEMAVPGDAVNAATTTRTEN